MEIIFTTATVFAILVIIATLRGGKQRNEKASYIYKAKAHLMTESEKAFFRVLVEITAEKYYVFPQVHLSGVLDHKIPKQSWKHAFRHINGKSVDYVLCDKITLKPVYAVELDDYTHEYKNRVERDREVERIFEHANIPLVRFSDYKTLSHDDIIARFTAAHRSD